MFLENIAHMQQNLFGIENHPNADKRKKLQSSAEAFFYHIFFCNINEKDFAIQFSTNSSRPKHLLMLLFLQSFSITRKAGPPKKLFDRIDFDLRTRTALGLHDLEETPFCPATKSKADA
ncbi:MAG TPA: hypothetical protein VKY57_08250 [Chitinispirillaceae bacterium]|nr:hypothetical protein [Chitinispirillaceae bacterium]